MTNNDTPDPGKANAGNTDESLEQPYVAALKSANKENEGQTNQPPCPPPDTDEDRATKTIPWRQHPSAPDVSWS